MPYTHFRYIAYQVPTVARTAGGNAIYGIPAGNITDPHPKLRGNTGDLSNDARTRVERFIKVMHKAEDILRNLGGDNAQTLKIFMAPEFYFRPDNNEVSYSVQEYRAIKDVLRNTIEEYFPNWLVIPGTIMWKWDQNSLKRLNPTNKNIYFNTSLYIYKKFFSRLTSRVVEKAYASNINGLPTGRHGNLTYLGGSSTNEEWTRYLTLPKRQKHRFTIAGVQCGLEICLEHIIPATYFRDGAAIGEGVLNTIPGIPRSRSTLQLHLLTAGGMLIHPRSVAAKVGGYILRNDGYNNPPQVNCIRVEGYDAPTDAAILLAGNIPVQRFFNLQGDLVLNAPPGDITWGNHPQRIYIYQARQIP